MLPLQPVVTQATCANGAVTTPTVVLVVTPGVTYELSPSGAYNGAVTTVVTVTATVVDGFGWGQVSLPWTKVSDLRATMTVTLNAASCAQVAAGGADRRRSVVPCRGGRTAVVDGGADRSDHLHVLCRGPYQQGQSVTITATLAPAGVGWAANLGDWTGMSATVATLAVTFKPMACIAASLVDPGVDQATCAEGVVTVPTVTLPTSTGVVYTVDPAGPYDGTADIEVLVTATVVNDYGWGQLPLGWTRVDAATATFTVDLVGGVV